MNHKTIPNNVTRIDFSKRRGGYGSRNRIASTYEDFSDDLTKVMPKPPAPGDLMLRREQVMQSRLREIAGVICKDGTIAMTVALNGGMPDERWLKRLICTIEDDGSRYKNGAPVSSVTVSECGRFVHLRSLPLRGKRPALTDVSPFTVIRISSPRGWKLETRIKEIVGWCTIAP